MNDTPEAKYTLSGAPIRTFDTGATRDTATGKFELAKYLSPAFINGFARYMNKHQVQSNGERRAGDNWQLGMPEETCLESLRRHEHDFWAILRGWTVRDEKGAEVTLEDAAYGLVFNIQIIMHQRHIAAKGKVLERGA